MEVAAVRGDNRAPIPVGEVGVAMAQRALMQAQIEASTMGEGVWSMAYQIWTVFIWDQEVVAEQVMPLLLVER